MKTNRAPTYAAHTHEGGPDAPHASPLEELRRTVATCLLWEPTCYETGESIAARIAALCRAVPPREIAALAITARTTWKLRHVPLWLCVQLLVAMNRFDSPTRRLDEGADVAATLDAVLLRPDQVTELLALYWRANPRPEVRARAMLPRQMKQGIARAFRRFTAYQLAKWDRPGAVRLRDALFLSHARPGDAEQAALWRQLIDGTLAAPDTWEVALSAGQDKCATWTRLLTERRLGYLALLMNLRNMLAAGVDPSVIEERLIAGGRTSWALPFRFVAAFRAAPQLLRALDQAMIASLAQLVEDRGLMGGATTLVIDVSGSMEDPLSSRGGGTSRLEAASALAILCGALCPQLRVFTFSQELVEIPPYAGLALLDAIAHSQRHRGTYLGKALDTLSTEAKIDGARVIVVTDEQSHDELPACWTPHGYVLNVGPYAPGLALGGPGGWQRINGFSERSLEWMLLHEAASAPTNSEGEAR